MDGEALQTFLTVYRQQGFSKAAKVLHRTQPAISRRIRLLEEELGVPVFERAAGPVVLSQAGQTLLPYAERALAALQDALSAVRELRTGHAGQVSLATVGTLAGGELSGVLRRFAQRHPTVNLTLRTARSVEVSDLVRRGEVTLGLRYERDRSRDLRCEELASEPLRVVCAPAHRLAGRSIRALRELRDERWLAFPEVPGQREIAATHVFAVFLSLGLGEVDWTPVDSLTVQKRLVEAGLGLALMTESSVAEERAAGAIRIIDVADLRAAMPVYLVTRREGFLSGAAQALASLLRTGYALDGKSTAPGAGRQRRRSRGGRPASRPRRPS